MTLTKGMRIKETRENANKLFENTVANSCLVYEVVTVNHKTYTLKCVDGFMKGTGCKLSKEFKEEYKDVYGTITRWEVVA